MSAGKVTPGVWTWWTSNSWRRLFAENGSRRHSVLMPVTCHDGHPDISVTQADMDLIAEAGTVHNETGKTPRQLASDYDALSHQRDELREENERLNEKDRMKTHEINVLTPENRGLREALIEARTFVDRHSESWCSSGQELLRRIDEALNSRGGQ